MNLWKSKDEDLMLKFNIHEYLMMLIAIISAVCSFQKSVFTQPVPLELWSTWCASPSHVGKRGRMCHPT